MWRRRVGVGLVLILACLLGGFPSGPGAISGPREVLAAERIVLLRLNSDGGVLEINPATRVTFKDLDTYLRRRLDGKRVLEVKLQERLKGCDQLIVIRYEE